MEGYEEANERIRQDWGHILETYSNKEMEILFRYVTGWVAGHGLDSREEMHRVVDQSFPTIPKDK
jgi:hypothetical protein